MPHRLTEDLLRRASQWKAFHEWEQNRRDEALTLPVRVAWYASAFDFVNKSLRRRAISNKPDKTALVRHLQACLKHVKPGDRHG